MAIGDGERRKLWRPSRFTTTTQTHSAPMCRCGHWATDHLDGLGACQYPTAPCGCLAYTEVCPVCNHIKDYDAGDGSGPRYHTGANGQCTQIIQESLLECGCAYYVEADQTQPATNTMRGS